jgi:hypothetical protein
MAANENSHVSAAGLARASSLIRRLIDRVNLRALLNSLSEGRRNTHPESSVTTGRPEQSMMRATEYLEICEENALDAYTVEDALYWHNEIITELSLELNLVGAARPA